ncbi:antibiotic biosynthesis monooxygenase [Pseudomonas sp. NPDC090202]|uniref:antibiotic biosynthesis monooxygenase n=1 Tax=Pseudomonas sp. NPDC090202 TaxID=3364476 RepID=UPI0037F86F54
MLVRAINTVEIRVPAGVDIHLKMHLGYFAARLGELPGCLAYTVARSRCDSNVWIMSGHWSAQEHMKSHFSNKLMDSMLRSLVGDPITIAFSHFVTPEPEEVVDAPVPVLPLPREGVAKKTVTT